MAFTDSQIRKLKSKLKPQHVRVREADGQALHYLEGWHVVAEANRIFGFDAWDRETVSNACVWTKQVSGRYCAAYVARVRITVRAGEGVVIREGSGAGESNEATPGQAHDRASKAAETDATKRALTTFGNSFGLNLYASLPESERRAKVPQNGSAHSPLAQTPPAQTSLPGGPNNGHHSDPDVNGLPSAAVIKDETQPLVDATDREHAHHDRNGAVEPARVSDVANSDGPGKIEKSQLAISEPRRIRDPQHLKFVAEQPCLICGRQPCEAHHLRHAQPRALGRKASDAYTVPLCALHHRELHTRGDENAWWEAKGRDPMPAADDLWRQSRPG